MLTVSDDITVIRSGTTVAQVTPHEVTRKQLAELMVGSELPSPHGRSSEVGSEVLLNRTQLSDGAKAGAVAATGVLGVSKPIDGKPATHANGGTIGFAAKTPDLADAWHAAGLANGGTAIEDPPGVQEAHPIGDLARERHLVRGDEHRHAALAQPANRVEHFAHEFRIERGGGLIHHDHLRIAGDRARDFDQLLFGHPQVANVQAELSDIRRGIAGEVARIVSNLRNEFDVAQKREKSLQESLDRVSGAAGQSDSAAIKLRELEREAESNRQLYESFLAKFKEAREQTTLETTESRVITPGVAPREASFPRRAPVFSIAIVLGTAMGLNRRLETLMDGWVMILLTIPSLAYAIFALLADRTGYLSAFSVLAFASLSVAVMPPVTSPVTVASSSVAPSLNTLSVAKVICAAFLTLAS